MTRTLLILIAAIVLVAPARAATVLHAARIHTVSDGTVDDGELIVGDDGSIVAVGPAGTLDVAGLERVELGDLELYPGVIAASSSLGLTEISAVRPSNDFSEIGDHRARLLAYRAINPDSELIGVARQNGLTHVQVVPDGPLVRGRSGVLRTAGWTWEERLELGPNALHVSWPSMALDRSEDAAPMKEQRRQRAERQAELDRTVDRARAWAAASGVDRDLELEAWGPVVRGEMPVFVHADGEREIRAALQWAGRHELRMVISGGREAWRLADELAAAGVPVVLEQVMGLPSRDWDAPWTGYERAARLHEAGVKVVISLAPGAWNDSLARNLPFHAGMARAHGLPDDAALAAITLHAAEVVGLGDRLGSIEPGKEASLIAVRGDLLEITDPVERMWIAGEEVSLENRHTKLYERYRNRPRPEEE